MKKYVFTSLILIIFAACTVLPPQTQPSNPTPIQSTSNRELGIENCIPQPYTIPTLPAKIPGYNELDTSIGLHVTGTYQVIDPASYHLTISGKVDHPLEISIDQLRCLPRETITPMLICPYVFEDKAVWTGVPLKTILNMASVQPGAKDLVLVSADGYQVELTLQEALQQDSLLAYEVNNQVLPILHGFPLRAVFPDLPGAKWVKWLVKIEIQ